MERKLEPGTNNPVVLLLASEILLVFIVALYGILWGWWMFSGTLVGNLAEVLANLMAISFVLYVPSTFFAILAFLWEGQKRYFKCGESIWADRKAIGHFVFCSTCSLLLFFFFLAAPNEGVPLNLRKMGAIKVLDTNYARAGFQRMLGCPVPGHVSQIYFQDQSSFDLNLGLQFNTTDESFVRDLIRELKLEPEEGDQKWEVFTDGYRTLKYDRNSGDVEVTWFTT